MIRGSVFIRTMSLFRPEVFEYRKDRLHGVVNLAVPISWQLVGSLFFIIVATAILFLSLAGYSRIETVAGVIVPEGGIVRIVPTRAGTVATLAVKTGDVVKQGQALATIQTGENLAGGAASDQILKALDNQERLIASQEQQIAASAEANQRQLRARISGLQADVAGLASQIDVQKKLVESAHRELALAQEIAGRGFVSRRDILQREETYLNRQQQLTQLRQRIAGQEAAIDEAQASILQSGAAAGVQIAALAPQKSDIAQRRTSAEVADSYRLSAPVAGIVAALTVRPGQAISPQSEIMAIVPNASRLRAELYVPSSAIGFLKLGQDVSLGIDAFPHQRFGTLPAQVTSIATAPVTQADAKGDSRGVYIVSVSLQRETVAAYGKREPLLAGMSLTARVTTERQSLIKWLFEPLFAIGGR